MITHSFIVAVVESYAMVEKQCRLMLRLVPDSWEMILVDDGSVPQIPEPVERPRTFQLLRTAETRKPGEWTQKLAINKAIEFARGEYIIKSDIDHVFTHGAIAAADRFEGDMMLFHRSPAKLRDDLSVEPLRESLTSPIDDIYVMRKALFLELGGYPEYLQRRYGGGGSPFWRYSKSAEAQPPTDAKIYAIPSEYETYHSLPRVPEYVAL